MAASLCSLLLAIGSWLLGLVGRWLRRPNSHEPKTGEEAETRLSIIARNVLAPRHRPRNSCAASHRDEDFLWLSHDLRSSTQHSSLPRLPRLSGSVTGSESQGRRARAADGDRHGMRDSSTLDLRAQELFLPRPS